MGGIILPKKCFQSRILAHYAGKILAFGDSVLLITTGSGDRKFKILFETPNAIIIRVDGDISNTLFFFIRTNFIRNKGFNSKKN